MIGILREEKEVGLKSFCVIRNNVIELKTKKYAYLKKYSRKRINNFTLFYVIKDNYFGNKELCVIVPLQHAFDGTGTYYLKKYLDNKSSKRGIIVSKKSMSIMNQSLFDFFEYGDSVIRRKISFANLFYGFKDTNLEIKTDGTTNNIN